MKLRERYEILRDAERKRHPGLPGSPEGRARVALCYPNRYLVGMANLGFQAVWSLLGSHPPAGHSQVHCDRLFLPEEDDWGPLKEGREELRTLDAFYPAREAHVIAFAVSFESDYLHVLSMLKMMGLPLRREERGPSDPILLAGGIGPTLNPGALAPFFDVIYLGEFEPQALEFAGLLHGLSMGSLSKKEFLERLRPEKGWLVSGRGDAAHPQRHEEFEKAPAWSEVLTPHSEFPNRVLIELERGCPFSCRFCAAGYAYGASRRHSLDALKKIIDEAVSIFGSGTGEPLSFGLIGGALTEYKWIVPLAKYIVEEKGCKFSLSSMRLKRMDPALLSLLVRSGQRQVTIAPETGSERLRAVIKKNYSDAEVLESVRLAVQAGLLNVKLYSMVGLPTETDADVDALLDLARRCRQVMVEAAKARGARPGEIILSVGPFVPKPGTPFERAPFCEPKILEARYERLREGLRRESNMDLRTEGIRGAYLETFLSRLSEEDAPLLLELHERIWKGESAGKALRALGEQIVPKVLGSAEGDFSWKTVQDERTRARLAREWKAAQEGRITA